MAIRLTRRRLLGLGASLGVTGMAGCLGGAGSTATPTPKTPAVVRSLGFDGPNLVIHLAESHAVSQLNLIAPDGSLFGQTSVAVGQTTARIELLDIKPVGAGFKHYTPGTHTLIAVGTERSFSQPVELVPDLKITDVHQYREGTRASDFGKLVVEVENVGSGPTWVYDVTNRDAPNRASNVRLSNDPGVLLIENGTEKNSIIAPGMSKSFQDVIFPLVFSSEGTPVCSGQLEMTVIVGSAILDPLEKQINLTIRGDAQQAGLAGQYTCSLVDVDLLDSPTKKS